MSAVSRARLLVGGAVAASLLLVLAYLAAGGSSYTPTQAQDPCEGREWRDPGSLDEIAEQFTLSALDGAACELGVTRETLARALATPETRERFMERYGIEDPELARAIRAGLLRAIDDAEEAGTLPSFAAEPLRDAVRQVGVDEAIELLRNARTLLDNLQSFLGPAQGLLDQLERFLPRG